MLILHVVSFRKVRFEFDEETGMIQRAWEGLLPNRILIYCM